MDRYWNAATNVTHRPMPTNNSSLLMPPFLVLLPLLFRVPITVAQSGQAMGGYGYTG